MKIALINASPRAADTASGTLLEGLKGYLPSTAETEEFCLRPGPLPEGCLPRLAACDVLIFASPLYVDGLPSHLVRALLELEEVVRAAPGRSRTVYAVLNCGFYEGEQNAIALRMLRNWCVRAGVRWGQGLGVGAGGMLGGMKIPMGKGPRKSLGRELEAMARNIALLAQADTRFVTADFPRVAYKAAAELGWRRAVRANGGKSKDLFAHPGEAAPQ